MNTPQFPLYDINVKKIKKEFYLISSSSLSCLMTPPYHPNPLIRTAVLKNESA